MNAIDSLPSNVAAGSPAQGMDRRQAPRGAEPTQTAQAAQAAKAAQAAQVAKRETRDDAERLKQAVESANKSLNSRNAQVQFAMDTDSGRMLVKLVDVETRKVLRQIPNEDMLRIAKNIDRMRGLGVDQAA